MLQYLNPLRWKRTFLFTMLLLFLVVWFGFIDSYSMLTRVKLASEKSELQDKIEQLKQETAILDEKIADLKANPDLLEKIAREQYGMRKNGEKVYRIITQ
ncbi:septum formation initiator family protein [bacterium]|nr:MAG: septum formation initiator family protein [bacterium]